MMAQNSDEEIRKKMQNARAHFQNMCTEIEVVRLHWEAQQKDFANLRIEVESQQAQVESMRRTLSNYKKLKQNADQKVLKISEDLKKQKEIGNLSATELQKQIYGNLGLELEIQRMEGVLQELKHKDQEHMKQINVFQLNLNQKEQALNDMKALHQDLIIKETQIRDDFQDAQKVLVSSLSELTSHGIIGVKKKGELDSEPFRSAMKGKFVGEEAEVKALEECS